ncbi:MAG: hypothetical protein JWR89_2549 [Tardiphaga sp.]|uniref:hypothetical protein n=1 Tax=Tardiphaga sp. TaxID=1926292 RepID=UPI002639204F|nr:hypothetical protein [Tardiphaga sp.]MDB5502647.1 hypothetical protein [Tardiphaga sp.]
MKRTDLVALSGAATKRVMANKVGVIGPTKEQLEKLEEHKKQKAAGKPAVGTRRTAASS